LRHSNDNIGHGFLLPVDCAAMIVDSLSQNNDVRRDPEVFHWDVDVNPARSFENYRLSSIEP
jgi:hypothetical protein